MAKQKAKKRRSQSTNDTRSKHPYMVAHNWLPGGKCCFWLGNKDEEYRDRMNAWAERMQGKVKENLITNNRAEL
jgi:hypothetical protein